jgi:MFS family permease
MLGVEFVGYWFVVFGIAAASFSYIVGFLAKYIGRIPMVIIALVLSAGLKIFLLFWKTNGEQSTIIPILYSLAVFYGIFEAIHQTQVNCKNICKFRREFNVFIKLIALVGVIFPDTNRAAFSANRLCLSLAGAIGYAYSGELCVINKCYIILVTFGISFFCYIFLEVKIRKDFIYSQVQKK